MKSATRSILLLSKSPQSLYSLAVGSSSIHTSLQCLLHLTLCIWSPVSVASPQCTLPQCYAHQTGPVVLCHPHSAFYFTRVGLFAVYMAGWFDAFKKTTDPHTCIKLRCPFSDAFGPAITGLQVRAQCGRHIQLWLRNTSHGSVPLYCK